ncbi:gamma-glutamylaminecyclotransferase isoform X2 [Varanus komodoensis]|uniref:gamma-glutamylaminecyclotransferase isoform X2 n=1 Tax=Varanus komodoensis TaxID=61221 RepID=UPI001CF77E4A|nr:gamma-glutamylaminecyclotransferase isoform X2 [Varanus komodoensis]
MVDGGTMESLECIPSVGRMARVFVYGTLKKGQPNYPHMINGAHGTSRFQGKGLTVERYPLVIAGKYNIPYLLNYPGKGHRVTGEIYSVDDQMLQFLDEFEGCPDMYQRTPVRIEVVDWEGKSSAPEGRPAVNSILECYMYSTATYQPEWINLPFYDDYDSSGKHRLPYVLRESRE